MEQNLLAGTRKLEFEAGEDMFHALGVALSLITNPTTSPPTLSSLLKTLIRCLNNPIPHLAHNSRVLSLLYALARRSADLRRETSVSLRTFAHLPSTPTPSLAHSLSVLFAIAEADDYVADESMFLSLCFRPCKASFRHWLLRNANRFGVRPSVLITVMLGFTKDPYPLTRRAALDGLVWLGEFVVVMEDQSLAQGCYFRATELLSDAEDFVRCAAVRAISEWGLLLVRFNHDECKIHWSDALFVQLCSVVRDMSMKVRIEAFDALAKVGIVSDNILLQSLSKKASSATKIKNYPGLYTAKLFRLPASSTAFAFVHGLEDEFFEVRRSACFALRSLATLSADFACEAVSLLMDMLNDDSAVVRLQALDTMHHMAMCDCLKMQEGYLHMFLGTLVDRNSLIRSAARRILELTRLDQLAMFKLCFQGLVRNLDFYPQDEGDLFSVLLCIGQNHGSFVVHLIQESLEEIEPSFGGTLRFVSTRTVALLVLAICAPVSVERGICSIAPIIYSYVVTLLGRICHSSVGIVNQNDLFSHLSLCSRFSFVSDFELFKGEGAAFPLSKRDMPFRERINGISESYCRKLLDLEQVVHIPECPLEMHDEVANSTNILQNIYNVWPLITCGFTDEATSILRGWKKELKASTYGSFENTAESVFVWQYLEVIELLGMVWNFCMFPLKSCSSGLGLLDILLGKLERSLNELRFKFIGLTSKEELHIFELVLVTYTLKVSNLKACCPNITLKKLSSVVAHVENLIETRSVEPSSYITGLQKTLGEIGNSTEAAIENPILLQESLQYYTLRQFVLTGMPLHVKANLDACNNHENPLHYVSGLPVGIPCDITLHNISSESRMWLKMTLHEKLRQFVYLDLNGFSSCDKLRKFTFVAPFYRTPKVTCFTLKVCVVLECSSEHVCWSKFAGGPKGELIRISEVKEVHLSRKGG